MSLGYSGYANLRAADEVAVVYSYCCYNINEEKWKEAKAVEDGEIFIERKAFVEPEIHEKVKKVSSGRKRLVVKRVAKEVPWTDLFESGRIKVKNCSNTWKNGDLGIDFMAQNILFKLFGEYQKTGKLPEHIDWMS